MNWKNYNESYEEEIGTSNVYRQDMITDMEKFLSNYIEKAEEQRKKFISPAKVVKNQNVYRKKLIEMLGFPLNENLPFGERVGKILVKKDELAEYYRMKIEVFPDFFAYGILAKNINVKKAPFVLAQHGGEGTSEIVNGWVLNSANYNHMVQRVLRKGASVFSTQLYLWSIPQYGNEYNRGEYNAKFRALGGSITAFEIEILRRVIDYFERQEYVDSEKIGMIGLSYGGMYTMMTSAIDTRIRSAYSSCFFNNREKWLWQDWAYNNMFAKFNDADICGLIAPRALLLELGNKDPICKVSNLDNEYIRLKEYYKAFKAECMCKLRIFDGEHELCSTDEGIDFFINNLK